MDQQRVGFSTSHDEQMQELSDESIQSFSIPAAHENGLLEAEEFRTKQGDESIEKQEFHITKPAAAPLKSCFKRRNSMTAETTLDESDFFGDEQPISTANGIPKTERKPPEIVDPFALNVTARLCGPSRSKCGYCGGKRLHVLGVDDGHNKVFDLREKGVKKPSIWSNVTDLDSVDEESTSKSYGLLFDYLPYDTYQELIDRGWRRSGKHLYRPHNFESCCPAISIRLDTTKFASCTSKSSQTELERSILVGGSKSQRRVGRNLLRALEAYNNKHGESTTIKQETCEQPGDSNMEMSHDLASNVVMASVTAMETDIANNHVRKIKRSRRASPQNEESIAKSCEQTESDFVSISDRQVLSNIEKSERGMLQKLAEHTYQAITDRVAKEVDANNRPKWAWWNEDQSSKVREIPKWCSYKFVPINQRCRKEDGESVSSTLIMASTVACAASSGRSRGLIDRAELAGAVVETLKGYLSEAQNYESRLEFHSVECHEKSGQVQVIFRLPQNYLTQVSQPQSPPIDSTSKMSTASKASVEEPFTEFLSRFHAEKPSNQTTHSESTHRQLHLVVKTVPVFESSLQPEVHRLFCTYQTNTHGDDNPFLCSEKNNNFGESDEEYRFLLQQKSVGFLDVDATYSHLSANQRSKIKKSYLSFYRFLCETPLKHEALDSSCTSGNSSEFSLADGYDTNIYHGGTYHQQYRLCTSKDSFDGPLVAVGVIDILPSCLSSVYAFYDPSVSAKLELGKYTALREIEWVRRSKWITKRNYYLGYYIHSCQKMIYKAEYRPSELLCPVHFKWVDFEVAKKLLESKSPVRHNCALYEDETNNGSAKEGIYIENIVLDVGDGGFLEDSNLLTVSMLSREGRRLIDPVIAEYVNEVGLELARKLIVKLS